MPWAKKITTSSDNVISYNPKSKIYIHRKHLIILDSMDKLTVTCTECAV